MKKIICAMSLFCGVFAFAANWVSTGRVLWVDGENGNDLTATSDDENLAYKTINAAVLDMQKNDIVKIKAGTYTLTEPITNSASFVSATHCYFTFMGEDPENRPVINGDGKCRGFFLSGAGMLFKDLIISNCVYSSDSTANTTAAAAVAFVSMFGGSLSDSDNWKYSARFDNCLFVENKTTSDAESYGGAVKNRYLRFYDCDFVKNRGGCGGAFFSYNYKSGGGAILSNCYFYGNSAYKSGGAIFVAASGNHGVTVYDSLFKSNFTEIVGLGHGGGAVSFWGWGKLKGCILTNNISAGVGGALYVRKGYAEIEDCDFIDNIAGRAKGGAHTYDGAVVSGYNEGNPTLTFKNSTFRKHSSEYSSSVIQYLRTAKISGCVFEDNEVPILKTYLSLSKLDMDNSVFRNNSSTCLNVVNTGVTNFITSCVFSNNTCTSSQKGTLSFNQKNARGYVRNSLFVNNSANYGGAVYYTCGDTALMSFENCTMADNSATRGGGVFLNGDNGVIMPVFTNCLISLNVATDEDYADIENNISSFGTECSLVNSFIGADPKFISDTYRIRPSSPCCDAGLNLPWMTESMTDIYGNPRIYNDIVDIGCSEAVWPFGMTIYVK